MEKNGPMGGVAPQSDFMYIIDMLDSELNESRRISDGIYSKAKDLYSFELKVDSEISDGSQKSISGVLPLLKEKIATLQYINRRNSEILNHLETLI
jgi:hypothetical protein